MTNDSADAIARKASELLGVPCACLIPTSTGLSKHLMDAHAGLRNFLVHSGVHDYASQAKGEVGKLSLTAWILVDVEFVQTTATLYRPATKSGDPRIWFRGLPKYASAGDRLIVLTYGGELYVVNASRADVLHSAWDRSTAVGNLVTKISGVAEQPPSPTSGLDRLQERAFGGEDVATRPDADDDEWWPAAPLLSGVHSLVRDCEERARQTTGMNVYFLLGGAGNGKSFAARTLAKRLGVSLTGDSQGLARRSYGDTSGDVDIVLLNDATIAPRQEYRERQATALASDVEKWWADSERKGIVAFCCVNRGIVIDELRALAKQGSPSDVSLAVLRWLVHPELEHWPRAVALEEPRLQASPEGTIREARVELYGRPMRVFAISVDSVSLMGTTPASEASRGRKLADDVLARCLQDAEARPELCPIRANVAQLSATGAMSNWEQLLHGAEIASGRLMSFRDLWGAIALSIIGPRVVHDGSSASTNVLKVDALLHRVTSSATLDERLQALLQLSKFRTHNALFRAPVPTLPDADAQFPAVVPIHPGMTLVDPSMSGTADGPVLERALQLISLGGRPSEKLKAMGLGLDGAWSPFDSALETAIVEKVTSDGCRDIVRRRLISWFSGYLTRLVGTTSGRFGNAEVIDAWRQCRAACHREPESPPDALEDPLRGLLFPSIPNMPAHTVLVPAFAARMEPLTSASDGNDGMLVESIKHASIAIFIRAVDHRLVLECRLAGTNVVVGQMALDFALIREALLWQNGRSGQSESSAFLEPRIERCRATSLGSANPTPRKLIALIGGVRVEFRP